jgi:enamine deaminase RidA (YjgF/YER057c/UK114 family)/catechol 2,3-dioxygenase-like lactoylglutathione lyase family enzyme
MAGVVKRINHVNITTSDVQAAQAFYGGVLGLEEIPRAEGARRAGAWYRLGELELHVSHEEIPNNLASTRHFSVEVADLDQLRAALERSGAVIEAGRPLPGIERLFTRDPSGNRIELQELTDSREIRPKRTNISTGTKWEPLVGYSRLVRVGEQIYVTGTTATLSEGGHVGDGDAYVQACQVLRNIERALGQVGASLDHVVRTRMFVTNIQRDWEAVGRAHAEFLGSVRPATTMVEVSRLIEDWMLVEIEADAVAGLES